MRHYHFFDRVLTELQSGIETVFGTYTATRTNPAHNTNASPLTTDEKKHSAGLMRVNHTGEVCAQALYRGQLSVAENIHTREILEKACAEETDHLAWCNDRLQELQSHQSYLNSFFLLEFFFHRRDCWKMW